MSALKIAFALALIEKICFAQTPSIQPDTWVVGSSGSYDGASNAYVAGGVHLCDPTSNPLTATAVTSPVSGMEEISALTVDEDGTIYFSVGTFHQLAGSIHKLIVQNGVVVSSQKLSMESFGFGDAPQALVVIGDKIWYLALGNTPVFAGINIGWIYKNSSSPQTRNSITTSAPSGSSFLFGTGLCTNGRDLFVGASNATLSGSTATNIFVIDTQRIASPPTWTNLASIPQPGGLAAGPCQLSLGRDGKLVAVDFAGQVYSVDPLGSSPSNTVAITSSGLPVQGQANAGSINLWRNEVAVASSGTGASDRRMYIVDSTGNWPSSSSTFFNLGRVNPTAVVAKHEIPFQLFGVGCYTASSPGPSTDPRIGWTGMPAQGTTFTVELRGGQTSTSGLPVILRNGLSNTTSSDVGALPHECADIGAPGCYIYDSNDSQTFFTSTPAGTMSASITVPTNPSLAGMVLYYQWLVSSSGANSLGWVASDALRTVLR